MRSNKQETGRRGEEMARRFLVGKGYRVVAMNYRAGRWGELDIICVDGAVLVFVEVKYRRTKQYGLAIEAVSAGKKERLRRAAQYYVLTHPEAEKAMRFDVVAIDGSVFPPKLDHFINAVMD